MAEGNETLEELQNLSNKELLERVAELDPETYPVAERAQNCLDQFEEELEDSE